MCRKWRVEMPDVGRQLGRQDQRLAEAADAVGRRIARADRAATGARAAVAGQRRALRQAAQTRARLVLQIFGQIEDRRRDLRGAARARPVGRMAQRDDQRASRPRRSSASDLLRDEGLRQARIALEHDRDPAAPTAGRSRPGRALRPARQPAPRSRPSPSQGPTSSADALEAVEQARDDAVGPARGLLRQAAQRRRHPAGSRSPSSASIPTRPSAAARSARRRLLEPRRRARHDQRRLVERQDLAERVVAAHARRRRRRAAISRSKRASKVMRVRPAADARPASGKPLAARAP